MTDFEVSRDFNLSQSVLFSWVSEPDYLAKWWMPENVRMGANKPDLRQLGPFKFSFIAEDGEEFFLSGEVLEINAPTKIAFSLIVPTPDNQGTLDAWASFTLREVDGGAANLCVLQKDMPKDLVEPSRQSWEHALEKLARAAG